LLLPDIAMKSALLLAALLAATSAYAADTTLTVKTLDKPAVAKSKQGAQRFTPPTISETRVVRKADGTLDMNCVQKANPKLLSARAGQAVGAKQP